jgi:hypothetical protein
MCCRYAKAGPLTKADETDAAAWTHVGTIWSREMHAPTKGMLDRPVHIRAGTARGFCIRVDGEGLVALCTPRFVSKVSSLSFFRLKGRSLVLLLVFGADIHRSLVLCEGSVMALESYFNVT